MRCVVVPLMGLVMLGGLVSSVQGQEATGAGFPDITSYQPDLQTPEMIDDEPAAGKRVRGTLPGYGGEIHYSLYLPTDWKPGGKYPVLVEYPGNGNYRNKYGDVCTGQVQDCNLGYGLSAGTGAIWVCLPLVDLQKQQNAITWWGDPEASVAFCKQAVKTVCEQFGGNPAAVFLCGFSRGAIACNFIGLHDDEIAGLWCGFFANSHYDGALEWRYPGSDKASARTRLARLGNRPVFVCQEVTSVDSDTYSVLHTVNYLVRTGQPLDKFTFHSVPLRNHTDRWVLYDLPTRRKLREWYRRTLAEIENR